MAVVGIEWNSEEKQPPNHGYAADSGLAAPVCVRLGRNGAIIVFCLANHATAAEARRTARLRAISRARLESWLWMEN